MNPLFVVRLLLQAFPLGAHHLPCTVQQVCLSMCLIGQTLPWNEAFESILGLLQEGWDSPGSLSRDLNRESSSTTQQSLICVGSYPSEHLIRETQSPPEVRAVEKGGYQHIDEPRPSKYWSNMREGSATHALSMGYNENPRSPASDRSGLLSSCMKPCLVLCMPPRQTLESARAVVELSV